MNLLKSIEVGTLYLNKDDTKKSHLLGINLFLIPIQRNEFTFFSPVILCFYLCYYYYYLKIIKHFPYTRHSAKHFSRIFPLNHLSYSTRSNYYLYLYLYSHFEFVVLNSGPRSSFTGALPLGPHLQPFYL
jgi:hypothetical protein